MKTRFRRPKAKEGQIIFQRHKVDGEIDMCVICGDNVPRCDRALVMTFFSSERQRFELGKMRPTFDPSFLDELESRGYDLDTLKFSIERKEG